MRLTRAFVPPIVALLALGLAACGTGEPEPTPVPATNTAAPPPVITQIVAPPTPTPPPTLAPQINTALGDWALRITLDVTGWEFADRLSYFGAATLTVDEQGVIEGSGYFSPPSTVARVMRWCWTRNRSPSRLQRQNRHAGAGTPIPSDSIWGGARDPRSALAAEHFRCSARMTSAACGSTARLCCGTCWERPIRPGPWALGQTFATTIEASPHPSKRE